MNSGTIAANVPTSYYSLLWHVYHNYKLSVKNCQNIVAVQCSLNSENNNFHCSGKAELQACTNTNSNPGVTLGQILGQASPKRVQSITSMAESSI